MAIDPRTIGKRIPYWQEEPVTLSEWQEEIERNVRSLNVDLNDLVTSVNQLSRFLVGQPITAGAIPTALTADLSLAAAMESIVQKMSPSSPSGQGDMPSGPAEWLYGCVAGNTAHPTRDLLMWWDMKAETPTLVIECRMCHASLRVAQIAAQDVDQTSSTSPKPDSNESVGSSAGESAPSASRFCRHPKEHETKAPDGHHFCGVCGEDLNWTEGYAPGMCIR